MAQNQFIILRMHKKLNKFIGLDNYDEAVRKTSLQTIIALTSLMLSSFTTASIAIITRHSEFQVVTELLFCVNIYIIVVGSYLTILFNSNSIRNLLNKMQTIVIESR